MPSYHPQEQTLAELPVPGAEEIAHSARLVEYLVGSIERNGGSLSFRDYMDGLLYAPGLGYYSAGLGKFGREGDFVTAPEISPLFGYTLARQCRQLFDQGCNASILEFGAGSGKLCAQILSRLDEAVEYLILEVSADLRDRQQANLRSQLDEKRFSRIRWLERLPRKFEGVVLANEVLDAMPVNLLEKRQQWVELGVGFDGERFVFKDYTPGGEAVDAMRKIEAETGELPEGYRTEVNLNYRPWLAALGEACERAALLLIDYGYERAGYYHPGRSTGTLLCHYRHRVHDDPLILPGLQDITASVDFDAVADAAEESGFVVEGLVSQSRFLIANGLLQEADGFGGDDTLARVAVAQQVKTLTMPGDMGERFKVIGLGKNLGFAPNVFSTR